MTSVSIDSMVEVAVTRFDTDLVCVKDLTPGMCVRDPQTGRAVPIHRVDLVHDPVGYREMVRYLGLRAEPGQLVCVPGVGWLPVVLVGTMVASEPCHGTASLVLEQRAAVLVDGVTCGASRAPTEGECRRWYAALQETTAVTHASAVTVTLPSAGCNVRISAGGGCRVVEHGRWAV
jgi:hypothetical protein